MALAPPAERIPCDGRGNAWPRREAYYPLALFGARNKLIVNTDFRASSRLTGRTIDAICHFGASIKAAAKPPPDVMLVTPEDVHAR
jgi:hypothetical protein